MYIWGASVVASAGYCFSNTKKKHWKKKVGKKQTKQKNSKKNTKCCDGDDTVMQVN